MKKGIYEHLSQVLTKENGDLYDPITSDMFKVDQITKVQKHRSDPKLIFIHFRGINGSVPLRFFDEEAQQVILNFIKARNSKLWDSLNDTDN